MSFGQSAWPYGGGTLGRDVSILASAQGVRHKVGGCVIDTSVMVPLLAAVTITAQARVIPVGDAYIRFGTVLCQINTGSAFPTGKKGMFVPYSAPLTATTSNGAIVVGQNTITLAAITGAVNPGDVLTIAAGGGTLETVQVGSVNGLVVTLANGTLTTSAHTTGVAITKVDDGRQTLRRGECFIMTGTRTLRELFNDQATEAIDAGIVHSARVASDVTGGVSTNPTLAQLETAFPMISWVKD